MRKVENNPRYKGGKDRVSVAKEDDFQICVKKVMELTKCSSEDAAYVLRENDYNVDQAVIAIFDRPDENVWKENKKKSKKDNLVKDANHNNRRTTASRNRFDSTNEKRVFRDSQDNQRNRSKSNQNTLKQDGYNNNNTRNTRSSNFHNKNGELKEKKQSDFPKVDSFSINTLPKIDGDNNWKNGPLVFEPSAPPVSSTVQYNSLVNGPIVVNNVPTVSSADSSTVNVSLGYTNTEKLSFAAVAAKTKKTTPLTLVSSSITSITSANLISAPSTAFQSSQVSSSQPLLNLSETTVASTAALQSLTVNSSVSTSQFTTTDLLNESPAVYTTPSYIPTSSALNVNQEFTDKLKNDIGLHNVSAISPVSSLSTVISNSPVSSITGNSLQNRNVYSLNHNNLQTTAPILDYITNSQSNSFNREVEFLTGNTSKLNLDIQFGFQIDSTLANNNTLSYTDSCNIDYQSSDIRNNNDPNTSNVLSSSLLSNNTNNKLNGTSTTLQQTSQSQQLNNNTILNVHQTTQQLSQNPVSSNSQQQTHQQSITQSQPSQSSQHSLQQQMYTAAAAQFPSYGFPYLYSPVTNMRDVEQFTTITPFPYGLNGINQLDMQLSGMLPPSMATPATGGITTATPNNQGNGSSSGLTSTINNSVSQAHHQLSQQPSQPSTQIQQQHRNSTQDGKYQLQVQPGATLTSLNGNVSFQNLGSASQQNPNHQSRNQTSNNLNNGLLTNNSSNNNSGVAPPPGFSTPHFVPQQNLQSLFHMPSYGHTPMPFPLMFSSGPQQQQQQQQSQQRQQPQNHHNQHLIQSQNHHQPQQRNNPTTGLGMDHVNFMEMGKYPQQSGNSNTNLQSLANAQSYHGNANNYNLGSGTQNQQIPLHRNQSINQNSNDW